MTFISRVEDFERNATWLDTNLHGPALEVMYYCAALLDAGNGGTTTSMTFRQTWSALMADRPKNEGTGSDEIELLIEGIGRP